MAQVSNNQRILDELIEKKIHLDVSKKGYVGESYSGELVHVHTKAQKPQESSLETANPETPSFTDKSESGASLKLGAPSVKDLATPAPKGTIASFGPTIETLGRAKDALPRLNGDASVWMVIYMASSAAFQAMQETVTAEWNSNTVMNQTMYECGVADSHFTYAMNMNSADQLKHDITKQLTQAIVDIVVGIATVVLSVLALRAGGESGGGQENPGAKLTNVEKTVPTEKPSLSNEDEGIEMKDMGKNTPEDDISETRTQNDQTRTQASRDNANASNRSESETKTQENNEQAKKSLQKEQLEGEKAQTGAKSKLQTIARAFKANQDNYMKLIQMLTGAASGGGSIGLSNAMQDHSKVSLQKTQATLAQYEKLSQTYTSTFGNWYQKQEGQVGSMTRSITDEVIPMLASVARSICGGAGALWTA